MPFLFIDYDAGIGGEYFCYNLSKANRCVTLAVDRYPSGRYQVNDVFGGAFLNLWYKQKNPIIKELAELPEAIISSATHYEIVPAHKTTGDAKELLQDVYSIRLAYPRDRKQHDFLQYLRKLKTGEPLNQKQFLGVTKYLKKVTKNPNFFKEIKYGMTIIELHLIALGRKPTEENIELYFNTMANNQYNFPEPNFHYDLIIPFEPLLFDIDWVKNSIKEKFDIIIKENWLERWNKDYETFTTKT